MHRICGHAHERLKAGDDLSGAVSARLQSLIKTRIPDSPACDRGGRDIPVLRVSLNGLNDLISGHGHIRDKSPLYVKGLLSPFCAIPAVVGFGL